METKRLFALAVLLVGVTAATSLFGAQKPAPAQATEQEMLKERVDALKSQQKADEEKADRAAFEKDRIESIQRETKDYYDKVLSTQTWTLGIVGLIITIVSAATARFGLSIFDRHIDAAISKATSDLERKFEQKLGEERQKLEKSNTDQMGRLKEAVEETINELAKDLKLRSDWQLQFLQGMAAVADGRLDDAVDGFRLAVIYYKSSKPRQALVRLVGEVSISNFFNMLERSTENESDRDERAREEIKSNLFDGLEDELAHAALSVDWLRPLIKERKEPSTTSAPAPEKAHSGTAPAPPNEPTTK